MTVLLDINCLVWNIYINLLISEPASIFAKTYYKSQAFEYFSIAFNLKKQFIYSNHQENA
jgi:hypothetical protein